MYDTTGFEDRIIIDSFDKYNFNNDESSISIISTPLNIPITPNEVKDISTLYDCNLATYKIISDSYNRLDCHNIPTPTYENEYVTFTDGFKERVLPMPIDPDENKLSVTDASIYYLNNKPCIKLTISNGFDTRYKYLYFDNNKFEYSTYLDLKANVNIKVYLYFNLIGSDKQKMVIITNQILNKIYDDTSSDKFLLKLDKNTIFGSPAQISNYNEFGYDIMDETDYINDIEDENIKNFISKPIKL